LYKRNFSDMLGDWCRAHGVEYIGHIIEDKNAAARMGHSAGHYFRATWGQDWSGMDIVLHQVIPGFAHNRCTGTFAGAEGDPDFFHYTLTKLCSSLSHINPRMKGRAMCEVFGAYGWAEGTRTMKWLIDHLLVRGVNRFVPHAFTSKFPDHDCPPHFGCEGKDPMSDGFKALMDYINKVAHLFDGSVHKANAAVLYHGESEWMSREDYQTDDSITVPLTDGHIDFDIIPCDVLFTSGLENGKLKVNLETYDCILIPYAANYPPQLITRLNTLAANGFTVIFADKTPENAKGAIAMKPEEMPVYLRSRGFSDISVENDSGYLRHYHAKKDGCDLFMFSNESLTEAFDSEIILPDGISAKYTCLNLMLGEIFTGIASNGRIKVTLPPYCSLIYIFDENTELCDTAPEWSTACEIKAEYAISAASYENLDDYKPYKTGELVNIFAASEMPDFGGRVKYTASVTIPENLTGKKLRLNLGHVCECASLKLNGKDCGIRICPPYVYDITDAAKPGENTVEITAATNLSMALREIDRLSPKLVIPPMGVLGPVTLETAN
nr:hypothetical protein [Clostridia bacterium]